MGLAFTEDVRQIDKEYKTPFLIDRIFDGELWMTTPQSNTYNTKLHFSFLLLCACVALASYLSCTLPIECQEDTDCSGTTKRCLIGSCKECSINEDCPTAHTCTLQNTCIPYVSEPIKRPEKTKDAGPKELPPEPTTECQPSEERQCYTGPNGSVGVGSCRAGKQTCNSLGSWDLCLGEITPIKEVCNGQDDDCDGQADEDCPCQNGQTQDCGQDEGICQKGTQTCRNGAWGECTGQITPKSETCNGEDDDCDGSVDEALTRACYTGSKQTRGVGICKDGVETCSKGKWGTCTGQTLPAKENCANKTDDDCDGKVNDGCDECNAKETRVCGASDVGECQKGTQTCSSTSPRKWGACVGEVKAKTEVCDNNKDDDCDGEIDEKCPCTSGVSRPCGTGVGSCQKGTQSCDSGMWGSCTGQKGPQTETCNGKDDDCDGIIDNATGGCLFTIAGSGQNQLKDGIALSAGLFSPYGLTSDGSSIVYFTDDDTIREFNPITYKVKTIAGSTQAGFANGTGSTAQFNYPTGITLSSAGDLYIADFRNHRIRKSTTAGVVTTFAGSGIPTSKDGKGTAAGFAAPKDLVFGGNDDLYVVEMSAHKIRKIDASGNSTTFVGGTKGSADGTGTNAEFDTPQGIAYDGKGQLYVADAGNLSIRKIVIATKAVTTLFDGNGANGFRGQPFRLALHGNTMYITCDSVQPATSSLYKLDINTKQLTLLIGTTTGDAQGPLSQAKLNTPRGIIWALGYLLIADRGNNVLRALTP
ncbi:MAG: hypothetical protein CL920_14860 [Deltaproteobacteria bacterium]|nr:hypothetical protein [Deltaproteobacteria bacterium]